MSYAKSMGKKIGHSTINTCISGNDIIYEVATTTAITTPVIMGSLNVSPSSLLGGSRISQFAPLFQRYRFKRFNLTYKPVVNVQYNGDVVLGYVADPTQELSGTGLALLQSDTQLSFKAVIPCWKNGGLSIRPSDMTTAPGMKFCCDPTEEADDVERYQGRLYFIADNLNSANTTYGRWFLDWEVEFYDPIITKANNGTVFYGGTTPDAALAKPFGSAINLVIAGDPSVFSLSANGTDNVLTFPDNGDYLIQFVYLVGTGGAALTSSSTIAISAGSTVTTAIVETCLTATAKTWWIRISCADNAQLTIHDTSGTHPTSDGRITVMRFGPGVVPGALTSKKALARQLREFSEQLSKLMTYQLSLTPPSFPTFPGLQGPAESQTSSSAVAEISDGNSPTKTVVWSENSSTSIGTLDVVAAAAAKAKKKQLKKRQVAEALSAALDDSDDAS